jgi:hypothetical protein
MMRKTLILAVALTLPLMAGTCSNNSAQQVVDLVKANCGILVSISDVAAAIAAPNPTVTGVNAIAHAICPKVQVSDADLIVLVQDQGQQQDQKDCVAVVNGVCIKKEEGK